MFNVGDIVTGINRSCYTYTNSDAIMKVVALRSDGGLVIKILNTQNVSHQDVVGFEFNVDSRDMTLVKPLDLENI